MLLRNAAFAGLLLLLPLAAPAANPKTPAQRQAEADLLAIHARDRRAHLSRDVNLLLQHAGPQLLDVRQGKVKVLTRDQLKARFGDYFGRATFSAWDDVEPPVVRASPDGLMGWMIVRVRIAYTDRDDSGRVSKHDSIMAWMSAYEKRGAIWIMTAVTSTSDEKQ